MFAEGDSDTGSLLGTPQVVIPDVVDPLNPGAAPVEHPIYGALVPKWPEGMGEGLDLEPSLKSFVDKESGEVNFANIIKSFVHGQKSMGSDKIIKPTEHSSKEEWDNIHQEMFGFQLDPNEYKLEREDTAKIPAEFYEDFKKIAHDNRIPIEKAKALMNFYEEKVGSSLTAQTALSATKVEEDTAALKEEWGEAFGKNLNAAKKVITEYGGDELATYLEESGLGNDTKVIKLLSQIGQKIYAEDSFIQSSSVVGAKTPAEASARIAEIQNNKAYWDANNPEQAALKKEMQLMYYYKNNGK